MKPGSSLPPQAASKEQPERQLPLDSTALLPNQEVAAKYSSAAYAQDLEVLLHRLGISSAWLIGHSLGGSIGVLAAKRLESAF